MRELLDDPTGSFYIDGEIILALKESLYVFGALTGYWRARSSFNITPSDTSQFYNLATLLPQYRPRTITLNSVVQEIQLHLLEDPSGIASTGMSGQVSIASILQAIQRARNLFVIDCKLPNTVHPNFTSSPPPDGLVEFPQTSVFVHRASWQDSGGQWANLWRQDAWAFDKGTYQWPSEPGAPTSYSESELAPLQLQIYPPPLSAGNLEAVTVDSLEMDITNPNSLFGLPDEWTNSVKYGALADLLTGGGQISDDLRGQYCTQRYQQAVAFAKDARTIIRLTCNGLPLPIDSLDAMDAGTPFWRNQPGPPQVAGVLYDLLAIGPVDQTYNIGIDVVQAAPVPFALGDFLPIGDENLDDILSYVANYLTLKCGGNEFKSTMVNYDQYMKAVATRKGVNAAKITYLEPLLGMWQREQGVRPDAKAVKG